MTSLPQQAPATDLLDRLRHFHGSETQYRHWAGRTRYTEGVQYLADAVGAHWLIDAIASHQPAMLDAYGHTARFQVWKLRVLPDHSAMLYGGEDTHKDTVVSLSRHGSVGQCQVMQRIEYTDFPLEEYVLYFVAGVLMLRGEY